MAGSAGRASRDVVRQVEKPVGDLDHIGTGHIGWVERRRNMPSRPASPQFSMVPC